MGKAIRAAIPALVLGVLCGPAIAATWQVATTACDDVTCTPCCTIQAAVEHCQGGDTVSVGPGTYPEQLDLGDMASQGTITLEASGGPGTVLVSPASGIALKHYVADAGAVTIDGIDFTTPDSKCLDMDHLGDLTLLDVTAIGCGNAAMDLESTGHLTIERCTVNSSGHDGIQVIDSASVRIVDCSLAGNTENGITIDVSADVTVIDTVSSGNGRANFEIFSGGLVHVERCTGNSSGVHSGFDIGSSAGDFLDGVELIDCTAKNNGPGGSRSGIIIDDVDGNVVVSGCQADGNSANGIDLRDITGRVLIAGSSASNNAWAGFKVGEVNQGPFFMLDSLSQGNGGEGLVIDPNPTPFEVVQIRRSKFFSNGDSGLKIDNLASGGSLKVQCSDVVGNLPEGLELFSTVTLDATKIWWGDASGPSGEGPGTGDSVISNSGTVLFDPWLIDVFASVDNCETFSSSFDSGSLHEWGVIIE